MRSLIASLVLAGLALPAAADTAFIIGNVDQASRAGYGAPRYLGGAFQALDQNGIRRISALDATAQTQREMFAALADAGEEDRIVIALAGRFVHFEGHSWFLGADAGPGQSVATAGAAGLSVELLMDVAAGSAARVLVLLAPEDQGVALGDGLVNGLGALEVPAGVSLATGHPSTLARFLRHDLMQRGRPLRDLFAAAPGMSVLVLDDPFQPFLPTLAVTPAVPPEEQSYWEAMSVLDNAFAYRAYLNRYPSGHYANEATARLAALEPPTPILSPEEVEQALGLSRSQRRAIQRDLRVMGHYDRGIDGLFGAGTRRGVQDWQVANGLAATGYLDAAQVTRLADQAELRRAETRAQDRAYWQQTGAGADEAGMRAYLERYPRGEFAETATARLEAIEAERLRQADLSYWQQTGQGADEAGLITYLERYPQGEFAALARQRLASYDRAYWQQTGAGGTEAGLVAYLRRYPDGAYADQANQQLDALRAASNDAQTWQQARAANTIAAYESYLRAFPNGRHASDARAAIAQLQAQAAPDPALGQNSQVQLRLAAQALAQLGLLEPGQQVNEEILIAGIRDFQRSMGLRPTGVMDQNTMAQMVIMGLVAQ